jgi:tRNA threonylcarbamoyladenosine biosynthesis protein TsaB
MKILGIETATAICGAALIDDGQLLAEYKLNIKHVHAEKLLAIVDTVLSDAGLTVIALDGIAVSIGPGSFTGLRIGLSAAKGLAYAANKPIVAVPTLDALAFNVVALCAANSELQICPVVHARGDEVYYALYRVEGNDMTLISDYVAIAIHDLAAQLRAPTIFVGNAVEQIANCSLAIDSLIPPQTLQLCSPTSVAMLGLDKLRRGDTADVAAVEPFYLKDFVARKVHDKI